jgi:hypothetical protein
MDECEVTNVEGLRFSASDDVSDTDVLHLGCPTVALQYTG